MRYVSFFFQAEDGIRDGHVTGVQTCALPISLFAGEPLGGDLAGVRGGRGLADAQEEAEGQELCHVVAEGHQGGGERSEERRVGKGWSAGGAGGHEGKNMRRNE